MSVHPSKMPPQPIALPTLQHTGWVLTDTAKASTMFSGIIYFDFSEWDIEVEYIVVTENGEIR